MKKIMVVDNDRIMLRLMTRLLEKEGHQVATAADGLQALDMLMDYTPDVIIVDLIMPNIDGKTLCKIIRNMHKLKDAYLIILSAIAAEEKINIAQLGVNACIAKSPFNETAKHVLAVLDQPVLSSSQCLTEEVIGINTVYPRGITEELLSTKRHFEMVLETITEGILEVNSNGRIIYANSTALSLIDIPEENLLGTYFFELFAEDDRKRVTDLMEKANGRPPKISEDDLVYLNRYQVVLNILPLKAGGFASIIILNDLSEQKRTEAALRKTNNFLTNILDSSYSISIVSTDLEQNILFWNKGAENIFGYKAEEVVNRQKIDILYHEDEKKRVSDEIRPLIMKDKKSGGFEIREVTKDGRILWMNLNLSPRFDEKGHVVGILGVGEDITERKELEAQLQQAQKLESVGILAGGIAHDFNNILTTIIGNASLALMKVGKDGPLREEIEEIKIAGERAAALTSQLLAFSRKQIVQPEILDLNELLTDIEKMLGRLIGEDVELLMIPGPALWQVEADPGQVEQIIMNLAVNAKDAMPKGGKLTVETANVDLDKSYFRKHGIKEDQPGSYVMLAVSDTGIGMDKETQEHIFEPFYTTKEIGKGTGLGLSTVYGIVKQSNGFIWANSEPGQGSTFKIYLPKAKGDVVLEKKEQHPVTELGDS